MKKVIYNEVILNRVIRILLSGSCCHLSIDPTDNPIDNSYQCIKEFSRKHKLIIGPGQRSGTYVLLQSAFNNPSIDERDVLTMEYFIKMNRDTKINKLLHGV